MRQHPGGFTRFLQAALLVSSLLGSMSCGGGGEKQATTSPSDAPPTIVSQPADRFVPVGESVVFTVQASDPGPLSYQWEKNGSKVGTNSATYKIPAATPNDNGAKVSVTVTNAAGLSTESVQATLEVTESVEAPTIIVQPQPASVTVGRTATFTVEVRGTAPMRYQWKKDGADVNENDPSYTTPATSSSDDGSTYSVVVTNAAGRAESESVVLSVTTSEVAPTIRTQPGPATVSAGQKATFRVVATGTTPFTYQWLRDGSPVGSNSSSYSTAATTGTDNGAVFSVVISNAAGRTESRGATLTVSDPTPPTSTCAPAPTSSTVVNVRDMGAKGDGRTDDTRAIQSAVDAVKGSGGTVLIPAGTYLLNKQSSNTGIRLGSNMTLRMDGALLQAIPSSNSSYYLVLASGVQDVNVVGGTVQGDYAQHLGSVAQGGMGVYIVNSQRVFVEGVTSKECWGDGFYIGERSSDITLCGVVSDGNCRAGMSITNGTGIRINNSIFKNSHNASDSLPSCGLNIEPNEGEFVADVFISGCTFEGNQAMGLASGEPCVHSVGDVTRVIIENNIARNNMYSGIAISNSTGTRITQNTVIGNGDFGIVLSGCGSDSSRGANDAVISGNIVSNNRSDGIHQEYCLNSTITNNTGSGNGRYGVQSSYCTNTDVSGNTVHGAAGDTHATN